MVEILHRLVAHPWIYDLVQYLLGYGRLRQLLLPYLMQTEGQLVLDVGGGTANSASLLHPDATYFWLDNDLQKLQGYKSKNLSSLAILGDGTRIGLRDKSVDCVLCISVAHHLSDDQLSLLMSELSRVTRRRLIFWDPVKYESSRISELLWKYDRGSYPRTAEILRAFISAKFTLERVEHHSIYHHYLLCVGNPQEH